MDSEEPLDSLVADDGAHLASAYDEVDSGEDTSLNGSHPLSVNPELVMMSEDPLVLLTAGDFQLKPQAEVASARFRLDATLQHLVEKKDESYTASDGESGGLQSSFARKKQKARKKTGKADSAMSPMQSPRKAGKSRKRKRKDDANDFQSGPQHQTFIMKLFDRSVDLAQFDENSPLYPICRAWIQNQPGNRTLYKRERTPTPEPPEPSTSQDDEALSDVYHLPLPVKDEYSQCGRRVPTPIPRPDEVLNIHQEPDQAPHPEHLLLDHMVRWKQIRNLWQETSLSNETRYTGSLNLLQDMFERNIKE